MGLRHSQLLCTLALYLLAEQSFAVAPLACQHHKLLAYYRFADDALCIFETSAPLTQWFQRFKSMCGFFRPEIVETSSISVDMLNLRIFFDSKTRRFSTIALWRSLNHIPLELSSGHPHHTLVNYAPAVIKSVVPLCSSPSLAKHVVELWIARFERFFFPSAFVNYLHKVLKRALDQHRTIPRCGENFEWFIISY